MRHTGLGKDRTPGCCSCTCQSCCVLLRRQPVTKRIDISGQGQEERNRAAWEGRGMGTTSELSLFCTENSLCELGDGGMASQVRNHPHQAAEL